MSRKKDVRLVGNLPDDPRGFVGRGAELAWLASESAPHGGGRLLTLLGVGGVGKTRLALRAARQAREAYPDGVWLVELSAVRARGQVPLAVLEALRIADQGTGSVTEVLCAWAQDKRLLLVLDSCEHVLPDCAALAADLLAAAPGLRILATSRERLGLVGERALAVDPLPVADADALFVQRAREVDPEFVLDDASRPRVAEICRILDGIPLALELAAARLESYSLDKLCDLLADRMGSRLDVLCVDGGVPSVAGERRPGPSRHRTLRTAIGWSHELCAPLERLLWARLSVFAGTFAAGAATWVCAGGPLPAEQIPQVLLRLVQQSVVLRHPADPERFRLLDTIREYGADWLRELGEEETVRLRHRDHYRRFATEACGDWNTGRQVAWCERVFAEHANLRTAMEGALADPGGRVALEMAGTVGFLWRHCGMARDAQRCLDVVLAAGHTEGPELELALWSRAAVALNQGELDVASDWGRRCVDAAREQGDTAAVRAAVYPLGTQLALSGRLPEAVDMLSSVRTLPAGQDWRGAADLQRRLALAHAKLFGGALDEARETLEALRVDIDRCGERFARAVADSLFAHLALMLGDHGTALRHAREAVTGNRLLHSVVGTAYAYGPLVSAAAQGRDSRYAARLEGIGRRVWEAVGRAHFDSPQLIAAQRERERLLRERLGDEGYEQAYAEGLAMSYDDGLDHALNPGS